MTILSKMTKSVLESTTASIASGTSISGAINLGGLRLFAIVMPSSWTTANLTFQASYDGGTTWVNMYDASGTELNITASASRMIYLDPYIFSSVPMIKVRSGTSASPVNQAADRTITLVLRAV